MSRLFIVRHGNTFAPNETPRRIGARTDLPLVASGIAQAERLGQEFAAEGLRFTRALLSPLLRTRQTLETLVERLDYAPSVETVDWLAEIDHGPDEDRTDTEIIARIGEEGLRQWDSEALPPPGWNVDGPARLLAWQTLFADTAGRDQDILIVTSNGSARFALMAHDDLLASAGPSLKMRTGAWGRIDIDREGRPKLVEWDRRPG